jgi:hypothetical protein
MLGRLVSSSLIAELPYTALREMVLTHPTLVEGLGHLFSSEPTVENRQMRMAH